METVRRLTREVHIQAKYDRSLEVLRYLKEKESTEQSLELCLVLVKRRRSFQT
jgi:lipoic acid synthetase